MDRKEFREKRRKLSQLAVSELIDLLSSDDLDTRFLAEMCLRDATST
jgi:hypothetical protein